jgi:LacI family transcriptional regulator
MNDSADLLNPNIGARDLMERLRIDDVARDGLAQPQDRLGGAIALVFTTHLMADDRHEYIGPLARAARARAAEHGCDVIYCAPSLDHWLEADVVERCVAYGVSGLVVLGGADGNPDVLTERWNLPTVFVEYDTLGSRSAHIGIDNYAAFSELVTHLIGLGHSRIAHIAGFLDCRVGAERFQGYRATLQRIGMPAPPEYVVSGDFLVQSGYDGMKKLLALDEPPTAVTCACDVQAVGAIAALEEAGLRCPTDVAVTGFDNTAWAETMSPALTTVRQPGRDIGRAAIDCLAAMIRDPGMAPPKVILPTELMVRESCGASLLAARAA